MAGFILMKKLCLRTARLTFCGLGQYLKTCSYAMHATIQDALIQIIFSLEPALIILLIWLRKAVILNNKRHIARMDMNTTTSILITSPSQVAENRDGAEPATGLNIININMAYR